jgi:multidrug resistance efflux pump
MSTLKRSTSHVTTYRRASWKSPLRYWPLFIWLLVLLLASILYFNGGKYRLMVGMVERSTETIASTETARVIRLHVREGDRVEPGDLIAELDPGLIDLEIAMAVEDQLNRRSTFSLEELSLERQFAAAVQDLENRLFETKTQQKINQAEAESLETEVSRLEKLRKQGLIDQALLSENLIRLAQIKSSLAEAPKRIDTLMKKRDEAIARDKEMRERLATNKRAFLSNEHDPKNPGTLALLKKRREEYSLKSSQGGVVVDLNIRPGDVIQPATPAATLLLSGQKRIIGFLPESNANTLKVGQVASIRPSVTKLNGTHLFAKVSSVSPGVFSLPGRVSPVPGQAVRGQRVVFEIIDSDLELLPGESVAIEIQSTFMNTFFGQDRSSN